MFFYFISKFIYFKNIHLNDAKEPYLYVVYLFLNKVFFILTFVLLLFFFKRKKINSEFDYKFSNSGNQFMDIKKCVDKWMYDISNENYVF